MVKRPRATITYEEAYAFAITEDTVLARQRFAELAHEIVGPESADWTRDEVALAAAANDLILDSEHLSAKRAVTLCDPVLLNDHPSLSVMLINMGQERSIVLQVEDLHRFIGNFGPGVLRLIHLRWPPE